MITAIKLSSKPARQKSTLSHYRRVNRVLWQVLILNLVVAAAKVIVGIFIGSISMLADGFHSAMDASSNVIGIIGSSIAGRPPDSDHPYGHYKYETFATLGIGLLLLLTSWNVLKSIFTRVAAGTTPEITTLSFVVMIATIALNLVVVIYERRQGRRLQSSLLLADASHTKSDIFVSLSVLISLVVIKAGWVWIDIVVALAIVGIIGRTGWQIVRRASDVLADSAVVDPAAVEKIVLGVKGVESCHKIRSRGSEQTAHLDLHIQVNGEMSLEQAHQLGHITQHRLKQALGVADVMVHVEPVKAAPEISAQNHTMVCLPDEQPIPHSRR